MEPSIESEKKWAVLAEQIDEFLLCYALSGFTNDSEKGRVHLLKMPGSIHRDGVLGAMSDYNLSPTISSLSMTIKQILKKHMICFKLVGFDYQFKQSIVIQNIPDQLSEYAINQQIHDWIKMTFEPPIEIVTTTDEEG